MGAQADAQPLLERTHTECQALKPVLLALDPVTREVDFLETKHHPLERTPSYARADHAQN